MPTLPKWDIHAYSHDVTLMSQAYRLQRLVQQTGLDWRNGDDRQWLWPVFNKVSMAAVDFWDRSGYEGQGQVITSTDTMGCNYLSLPFISAAGTHWILISVLKYLSAFWVSGAVVCEKCCIDSDFTQIVPTGPINNEPQLVQMLIWRIIDLKIVG